MIFYGYLACFSNISRAALESNIALGSASPFKFHRSPKEEKLIEEIVMVNARIYLSYAFSRFLSGELPCRIKKETRKT